MDCSSFRREPDPPFSTPSVIGYRCFPCANRGTNILHNSVSILRGVQKSLLREKIRVFLFYGTACLECYFLRPQSG